MNLECSKKIFDGEVYNHIVCQNANEHTISVILYQDAFEIVNPLGSAKTIHNILAVYMVLGNLPSHIRTKTDNVQLVLLRRENDLKYFGPNVVFRQLITELKDLEVNAITVG